MGLGVGAGLGGRGAYIEAKRVVPHAASVEAALGIGGEGEASPHPALGLVRARVRVRVTLTLTLTLTQTLLCPGPTAQHAAGGGARASGRARGRRAQAGGWQTPLSMWALTYMRASGQSITLGTVCFPDPV